jgi:hypothetical protein
MFRYLLAAALATLSLAAQSHSVEISLERHQGGAWKSIDPGLVLDQGDLLRFRVRTSFNGYLYVINAGTSGAQTLLFPGDATGRSNRVQAGKDYFVPSTADASFRVAGPPGQDVVYWLISPLPLESNPAAALDRSEPRPSGKLIPRCDDAVYRARGLCIDSSAGPRNVGEEEALPDGISAVPKMTRRELVIVQNKDVARVSAPSALAGPVICEFRVAHR